MVPEKLTVLGRTYKVLVGPETDEKLKKRQLLGEVHHIGSEIWLRSDIDEDLQKETLLHEILHIISFRGVELKEDVITVLTTGLWDFFKQNDCSWIFGKRKRRK